MDDFDPITCPLQGCVFIEASAGTGKTHSITSLVLRLVLEEDVDPDKLLLVTYTNAATDELRRKTRDRLAAALRQLEAHEAASPLEDPLIQGLIVHQRIDPAAARLRLRQVLLQLDELAVLTIHGFCQRVLHDRAFESGQLFDTEIEPDESALLRSAVLDFWRRQLHLQSEGFFAYLKEKRHGVDELLRLARAATSCSDAKLLPPPQTLASQEAEAAFLTLVHTARAQLAQEKEALLELLSLASLNRRVYQARRTRQWLSQVESWLKDPFPLPSRCDKLARFTTASLNEATKEDAIPPSHAFFSLCDQLEAEGTQLEQVFAAQWVDLKRHLLDELRQRLPEHKQKLNRYAYDDLLQNTLRALDEDTTGLTTSLAKQYPWILIDEFQDTDPTQYAIFRHLHRGPEHPLLCLIGDPKQAIYAFRGGDIFTYTEARAQADHRATLRENWRSSAALIRAVNTVYQAVPLPFRSQSIRYHAVSAAQRPPQQPQPALSGIDEALAPLQIWQLPNQRETAQTDRGCINATCDEISRLIQLGQREELLVDGRPLRPSDIAILIRSHYQAQGLQQALQQRGIRTVSYDRQHIFATEEACQLEVFLQIMANPRDENLIKALLLSDLMGYRPKDLEAVMHDDARWGQWLELMSAYRAQWRREGFIVTFRRYLREQHLPRRLLRLPQGERRLTNLLHLSELTEEAQATGKLSIHATLQWFRAQRESALSEEKELRLESDDERVKILTIHRSKGLEFPVVFLPFAWLGSTGTRAVDHVTFHDASEGAYQRCLDVGSEAFEAHVQRSQEEESGEELRMLYVALTRAKHRLYLFAVLDSPKYRASSLAYLWHHRQDDQPLTLPEFQERLEPYSTAKFREDLVKLVGASQNSIGLRTWDGHRHSKLIPSPEIEETLQPRRFTKGQADLWGVTSYSGLIGHGDAAESPDRDTTSNGPSPLTEFATDALADMADLPKGARTGNMIHSLYEHLSFHATTEQIREAAAHQLAAHGLSVEEWLEPLTRHTADVFQCNLGTFALGDIAHDRRLNELAFHFPIGSLTMARLARFFEDFEIDIDHPSLDFQPIEGFMKGFIDLVVEHEERFYIIDYKSNRLGPTLEDYHSTRLEQSMRSANYILQFHLYTVALHRYLRYRLGKKYDYDRHFGGVRYLFIRGMTPSQSPTYGVFRNRPTADCIEGLSNCLSHPSTEAAHASC